jgi:hypothetical protein
VTELERELRLLAQDADWPPTPDLAVAVRARLGERPRPMPAARRRRLVALVAAALLVPAASVLAISSDVRDAALEWLGLRGASIERVPTLPNVPPWVGIDLGPAVSLQEARRRSGLPVAVPRTLGAPDAVHLVERGGLARVSLVYEPRPGLPQAPQTGVGLLVTELAGRQDRRGLAKLAASGTEVRQLTVAGRRAVALRGAPHAVAFLDGEGELRTERLRLAATTLLVDRDGVLVRLEGDVPVAVLARIAASLP